MNGLRQCGIIYNGILFIHKEEWNFVVCGKWIGTGEHHCKWSYPGSESQKPHVFFHMSNKDLIQTAVLWKTGHTKGRSHMRGWW
jgi:hypothetical protein